MDDFSAFTDGERQLLEALNRLGVRFLLAGASAAVLQGANSFVLSLDGIPLRVLELERIIESKRAAHRAKDTAALPALEEALAALKSREPG